MTTPLVSFAHGTNGIHFCKYVGDVLFIWTDCVTGLDAVRQ
jgi:hypothetical protein